MSRHDAGPERRVDLAGLAAAVEAFGRERDEVVFAYLFGSHATGQAQARSDVDIALYLDGDGGLLDELRLTEALARSVGHEDLDVVVLNQAPLWLAYRVVGEGRVVFSRDEPRRIRFREEVEKRFLDFKPFHDEYLSAVRQRARAGTLSSG